MPRILKSAPAAGSKAYKDANIFKSSYLNTISLCTVTGAHITIALCDCTSNIIVTVFTVHIMMVCTRIIPQPDTVILYRSGSSFKNLQKNHRWTIAEMAEKQSHLHEHDRSFESMHLYEWHASEDHRKPSHESLCCKTYELKLFSAFVFRYYWFALTADAKNKQLHLLHVFNNGQLSPIGQKM